MVARSAMVGVAVVFALVVAGCGASTADPQQGAASVPESFAALEPPPTAAPSPPVAAPAPEQTEVPVPTPPATPTEVPTPTPVPVLSRTLLFSGDVLSHTPVIAAALNYGTGRGSGWAYDYRPMFADVRARISAADLAICVLETPVSEDNIGLDGYPTFEAPRELVDALVDAGYDGCSTASNHSMDRGPSGVRTTLDQMDRVGLGHAGMARTEHDANAPRIYDLDGVSVAHLSWTYGLNGFVLPADEPWLVNVTDVEGILAEAARARAAGADLVVLSIQWGNEYQRSPSMEQEALADELTAAGMIDLIIGNHAHVVQPVTEVNGVPVVYGVGNSLSNQFDNCCRTGTQDGVMVEAVVEGNDEVGFEVAHLRIAPTWVDRSDFTIIDLAAAAGSALDPATRSTYEASIARTTEAVGLLGATVPISG